MACKEDPNSLSRDPYRRSRTRHFEKDFFLRSVTPSRSQDAILSTVHAAGYRFGTPTAWTYKGLRHVVTGRDAKTDVKWTVMAASE